jgi:hypothetical protein
MPRIKWNSQGESLLAKHQREAIEASAPRGHMGPLHVIVPEHSEVNPRTGKLEGTGKDGAAELWFGSQIVGNIVDDEDPEVEVA